MSEAVADLKQSAINRAQEHLRDFLASGQLLQFPRPTTPRVSVLLLLYNRAELTLSCLQSLLPQLEQTAAEVVLVDNASRDETGLLLERVRGATIIRNRDNRGYSRGVNQAAEAASGDYLLLLNNDTHVHRDSLATAVRFLNAQPDVGAVGGRVILLDGTLQEAGCSIWRNGHILQYGRGDSPTAPQYLFQRDVDYCSGVFLMTRRQLFARMGGLDPSFSPAYFEDADYCVRLWRAGWRVVYLPDVSLLHFENASSPGGQGLSELLQRNLVYFTQKHADWLSLQCTWGTPALWARGSHDDRFRVLYLPRCQNASFAPSVESVVRRLCALNCFVTVYPIEAAEEAHCGTKPNIPADVEVMRGGPLETLTDFLVQRHDYYDCVLAGDDEIGRRLPSWIRRTGKAA